MKTLTHRHQGSPHNVCTNLRSIVAWPGDPFVENIGLTFFSNTIADPVCRAHDTRAQIGGGKYSQPTGSELSANCKNSTSRANPRRTWRTIRAEIAHKPRRTRAQTAQDSRANRAQTTKIGSQKIQRNRNEPRVPLIPTTIYH